MPATCSARKQTLKARNHEACLQHMHRDLQILAPVALLPIITQSPVLSLASGPDHRMPGGRSSGAGNRASMGGQTSGGLSRSHGIAGMSNAGGEIFVGRSRSQSGGALSHRTSAAGGDAQSISASNATPRAPGGGNNSGSSDPRFEPAVDHAIPPKGDEDNPVYKWHNDFLQVGGAGNGGVIASKGWACVMLAADLYLCQSGCLQV